MSNLRPTFTVLAFALLVFSASMLAPLTLSILLETGNTEGFLVSALITAALGLLCWLLRVQDSARITPRQMFLITSVNWMVLSILASLPLILSQPSLSFVDALFEATSGITTTGSTVFVQVENLPKDILLWRSLIQWIGGLGIIGMAVAIFPYLKVGGMRLFQTESSDWSDSASGHVGQVAKDIVTAYFILTFLATVCFRCLGMDWFNACNHAMTTVSTGGYSTSDQSFGQFNSLPLLWACSFFMIASALPFLLYLQSFRSRAPIIFKDEQVRGFLIILLLASTVVLLSRFLINPHHLSLETITNTIFNIVSIITTTGYASEDYVAWGNVAWVVIFCATFLGGCSGSTSGGIKAFRFQILAKLYKEQISKAVHPSSLVKRFYNGRPVSDDVLVSTAAYIFIVFSSLVFFSIALALTGLDPMTSVTGAATALMNVGPGLGEVIGPTGNFSTLNSTAKLLLCFAMLLGRLEFLTLIVLFTRTYWKW